MGVRPAHTRSRRARLNIINSKEAARRAKDLESLPRLRAFRDYWKARR